MGKKPEYKLVNLAHSQQNVHVTRPYRPGLYRFRVAAQLLPPPIDSEARCLDLGGGMGEFAEILCSKGYMVTLVDLSENNVRHARERGYEAYRLDLNEGLALFNDNSFDGVAMLEVIEHIVNAEYLLQEVHRVLKPGGFLILSTPNFAWWPERLHILWGKPPAEEGYHYRFFTVDTIKSLCVKTGFEIVQEKYSMPAFGLNFLRRKLLGKTDRRHVLIPKWTSSLLAQVIFIHAQKVQ